MKNHAPGEYYHLFNRGMQKQLIFIDDQDRLRFLFLIIAFQSTHHIANIHRVIVANTNVLSRTLNIQPSFIKEIEQGRSLELILFCLMPNHFHLVVRELNDGAISKYMQRVLTAYTKYFNTRYKKSGHLFQSSYKSVHVGSDRQLMYLSAYIHKNPSELKEWHGKEDKYYWSSYQDCLGEKRLGSLLNLGIITDRYSPRVLKNQYRTFVKSSTAKESSVL